jgi:uncharacterized protein (DUF2147 family)
MRLSTLSIAGMAALAGAFPAKALGPHDVYGVWRQPDSGTLIQIFPCGGAVCAKIVWTSDANRLDARNPDPALRGRSLVGVELWRHAKETAPLQWSGSAYNPADGATVYGTLHLTGEGALLVASCNLNVMPCSERTWAKITPETAKAIANQAFQPEPPRQQASQPAPAPQVTAVAARAAPPPPKPATQPPVAKVKPPKAHAKTEAPRGGDPHGYYDLPHIHLAR